MCIRDSFESGVPLKSITIMVQKEVADRMKAEPGTKDYGALSLAVQYYAEPYLVAKMCIRDRSEAAYREKLAVEQTDFWFEGKASNFLSALCNSKGITKDDAEKIQEILDGLE